MNKNNTFISELFNLEGKTALITGASGQVGSELCNAFISAGCNVIASDIDENLGLVEKFSGSNNFKFLDLDITNVKQIKKSFNQAIKFFDSIDILINNAGVNTFKHPSQRTEEDFNFVTDVNLKGTFFCVQAYREVLNKTHQEKGNIINTASHYGTISPDFRIYTDCDRRNSEVYGATKAGIIQMTKYLAVDLASDGIRVNCVSPGGVYNPNNPQGSDFIKNYSNRTPLKRMANVEELTGAYLYLASDASSYTTGQNIIVDGGMSVW